MNVKVKNLQNTTGRVPVDTSRTWQKFWENKTGAQFTFCSCSDCFELAAVGGHVKKVDMNDDKWYIVPLCRKCNTKSADETYIVDHEKLVPVR